MTAMKKYLSLVKLLFSQQYRVKPSSDKKKRSGTIIAFVVLGICLLPTLIGLAFFSYTLGAVAGADAGLVSLLVLACQGLVFVFGTSSLLTNVFNSRDADKLLFLPVRSTTIFLAKLTVVYVNEVITTAVTVLFLLLPFGIGANASFCYYAMLPVALLLVPVLPLLIGCVFTMPLSALFAKISRNGVVRTIFQIVFFVTFMALYMVMFTQIQGVSGGGEDIGDIQVLVEQIVDRLRGLGEKLIYLHSNAMLSFAMVATTFYGWGVPFAISLTENAAILGVVVLIALPFYRWILSEALETGGGRRVRKVTAEQLQVKNKGVVKELIVTDFKRVLRNSQIGFQAFAGLVMMPLMIVVFYFAFNSGAEDGSLIELLKGNSTYQAIAPLVIVAYMSMLGIGSNVLGLYPISRENKSLYLLKSLPIEFGKILLAKVILSTALMVVVDFVTILLTVLLFGLDWYFGIAMLLTMLLLGFGGMCITTLLDLKSPKLGWTNFNQSLKNAKNSWMAMLVGLVIFLSLGILATGFVIWFVVTESVVAIVLMWCVIIGFATGFSALSYKIMTDRAAEYFTRIEA